MKKLMLSLATIALVAFSFTSCDMLGDLELFDRESEGECDFVYPITLITPDDATVVVNNEDELDAAFEEWETSNPNSDQKPAFQYPLDMTNANGETITVNNDEELEAAFAECKEKDDDHCGKGCKDKKDDDKECFDFVYPISMTMPDGTVVSGNDEDALKTAIDNWYTANPNSTAEPTFVYPITITYEDRTTKTINDEDELKAAYDDCE